MSPNEPLPSWPCFAEDEVAVAAEVLRSGAVNYWTGQQGRLFETEFAAFAGCKYAVALANGTVALELALRALGIEHGDEVVTTSRTFIASASSIVAVGAHPVFADVDRESQNITAEAIRAVISARTRAIIVVHLAGWPCDMDPILDLAREFGLYIIEDCAQAHGASYKGRPVGSMGDIGAFSFCQDKIMTTAGEGGMVTTNSESLWRKMWTYKDHGKSYEAVYTRNHPTGFRWLHESFGTNWRLSEVQSAVGRVQLRKVPKWVAKRRSHAEFMAKRLSSLRALRIPRVPDSIAHAYYKFSAFVKPEELLPNWNRDLILEEIVAQGIPCSTGSCSEVYLERAFPAEMQPTRRLPVARELGETSLMFQVHPTLESRHIEHTARVVEEVFSRATGVPIPDGEAEFALADSLIDECRV
jgi:dTDP-4-amino-4,6-dideoxygalactose transaminase